MHPLEVNIYFLDEDDDGYGVCFLRIVAFFQCCKSVESKQLRSNPNSLSETQQFSCRVSVFKSGGSLVDWGDHFKAASLHTLYSLCDARGVVVVWRPILKPFIDLAHSGGQACHLSVISELG